MQKPSKSRTQDVNPPWKKALDQNVRFLQDNLKLTESIFAYLIKEKVLSVEDIDMIRSSSDSDGGRTFELVKCLKKRNENCFDKFLHTLRNTGNKSVADKLEKSMPTSSRRKESNSDDEMDLILQTKDRQIQQLESKLVAKDRRIKELENVNNKLKSRVEIALEHLRDEIRRNSGPKRDDLTSAEETNKRDERLREAEEKVDELQSRVDELEQQLEGVKENLKTKEDELNVVLENERRMKKRLGLDEDATDREVMEQLQKICHTRVELKRAHDELADINRAKMDLDDCIKSLEHKKDNFQFEISQKDLEIQLICRSNTESALLKRKRDSPTVTRRQAQLPNSVAPKSSTATARVPPAVPQQGHIPMLPRRKPFASIEDRETKYCVICRRNYYLKDECRIHVEPIVSGRFSCCGSDANSKYVGCKMVNHLYIQFTGLGNEYIFYDDRGRPLDFKDQ